MVWLAGRRSAHAHGCALGGLGVGWRPGWWEVRCSWEGLATQVLVGRHGRVGAWRLVVGVPWWGAADVLTTHCSLVGGGVCLPG